MYSNEPMDTKKCSEHVGDSLVQTLHRHRMQIVCWESTVENYHTNILFLKIINNQRQSSACVFTGSNHASWGSDTTG